HHRDLVACRRAVAAVDHADFAASAVQGQLRPDRVLHRPLRADQPCCHAPDARPLEGGHLAGVRAGQGGGSRTREKDQPSRLTISPRRLTAANGSGPKRPENVIEAGPAPFSFSRPATTSSASPAATKVSRVRSEIASGPAPISAPSTS